MHAVIEFIGENGSGKTTLLRTLMGLVPAKTGSVRFGEQDLTRAKPEDRARAGIGNHSILHIDCCNRLHAEGQGRFGHVDDAGFRSRVAADLGQRIAQAIDRDVVVFVDLDVARAAEHE